MSVLNAPWLFQKMYEWVRPWMHEEVREMLHFHDTIEDLHQVCSLESIATHAIYLCFFIINCGLEPSEAIRGCFLVAMARSGSVKSCFTYLHAINLYPRTSIHFVLHSILTSQFYQRNMGVRLDPSTFPR